MAKAMGPFRDSRAPSWLSGLNHPLIGPVHTSCNENVDLKRSAHNAFLE